MKRFCRPLRARIAIFAVLALLWSQVVLAGHPACSMGFMALGQIDASSAATTDGPAHDCQEKSPSTEDVVCATHCGQGSLSSDVTRVPSVPELPAAVAPPVVQFVVLRGDPVRVRHHALPPPVSWHRPTAHPAALLLI